MKNLCILIAALTLFSCKNEVPVDYAILSGTIENISEMGITINEANGLIKKIITVSEEGSFIDTLKIEPGTYILFDGKNKALVYIEPGNNISVNYDADDFLNTLTFSGVGSEVSTYLVMKSKRQNEILGFGTDTYKLNEADYKAKMEEVKAKLSKLINDMEGISEEYKEKELRNLHYGYLGKLSIYERYHRHYANLPNFKTSEGFLSELEDLDYNNEVDFKFSSDYKTLVTSYYNAKAKLMAQKDSVSDGLSYLKSAASIENETIRNELLFVSAKFGINYTDQLDEFYQAFITVSTNEENNAIITATYNDLVSISKGKPSPRFIDFENAAGGTTSLDDLKGKYVFINVWATWSNPCLNEIPFLNEIEKKYRGKNIEFVSISVDKTTDHEKWKKMIEEKDLEGIQLFSDNSFQSDFIKGYLIKGIPRFILIDPEGNIVDSNAMRPSSEKLDEIFNELNI